MESVTIEFTAELETCGEGTGYRVPFLKSDMMTFSDKKSHLALWVNRFDTLPDYVGSERVRLLIQKRTGERIPSFIPSGEAIHADRWQVDVSKKRRVARISGTFLLEER